ncbi:hypothetical protein [Rhodococcus sp. WS3]|uniref:hypothetical protein n=1 Tax=Rhodococcus sp. WS3 TaxID=2486271 RepID=UPI001142A0C2|nr:hypothetical protein [Rhodococcus sp. WS3]
MNVSEFPKKSLSGVYQRAIFWILVVTLAASTGVAVSTNSRAVFVLFGVIAAVAFATRAPKSFVGFSGFIFLFVRTIEYRSGAPIAGYLDEACVFISAAVFPIRSFMATRRLHSIPGLPYFLIFLAFGLISAFVRQVPTEVLLSGLLLAGKGILFGWSVAQLDWRPSDIPRIVRVSVSIMSFILLCAFVNLVAPSFWMNSVMKSSGFGYRYGFPPIIGPFVHPGYFGTTVALFAIGVLAYRLQFGKSAVNTILLVASSMAAILTFRRKVLGALALCFGYLLVRGRGVVGLFALLGLSPIIAILAWPFISSIWDSTATEYLSNPGAVARIRLYIDGFSISADYFPFGAGLGRFGSATARSYYSPEYRSLNYDSIWGLGSTPESGKFLTDTFWPAVFGESGLIGGTCFVLALVAVFRRSLAGCRIAVDPGSKWIMLVCAVWTVELFVESLAGAVFTAAPTYGLYFGLIGICASLARCLPSEKALNGDEPVVAAKEKIRHDLA